MTASLVGAAAMTTSETMFLLDGATFSPYPRIDVDQTGLGWSYRMYRVADGEWVAVAAVKPEQLAAVMAEAGVDQPQDLEHAFEDRSSAGLLAALQTAGVPAELARIDQEQSFFDDPASIHSRLSVRYEQAQYGTLEQPGAFWDLGDMELHLELAPPGVGEHTAQVLTMLGYSDTEVEAFFADGVAVGTMSEKSGP